MLEEGDGGNRSHLERRWLLRELRACPCTRSLAHKHRGGIVLGLRCKNSRQQIFEALLKGKSRSRPFSMNSTPSADYLLCLLADMQITALLNIRQQQKPIAVFEHDLTNNP